MPDSQVLPSSPAGAKNRVRAGARTRADDSPASIVVYGAATCEDTAITRSRLRALGIPFREVDIDADADALARVISLEGRRVTPTVVIGSESSGSGDGPRAIAEPSIEQLETALAAGGHRFERPIARKLHGPLVEQPIPSWRGTSFVDLPRSFEGMRGRQQSTVFFAHDAGCLACHGYAKQLAGQLDPMEEAEGVPIVVVSDQPEAVRAWIPELPVRIPLIADPERQWSRTVATVLDATPDQVMLLVLDRYLAPRAVSAAAEAGGLISPNDATEWLRYLELECPECGNDLSWPGV